MASDDGRRPGREPGLEIILRTERPEDADAVGGVLNAAFWPTERMPELVQALRPYSRSRDHDQPRSYVAERHGVICGYVMLTRCRIDAWRRLVPALVLGPLAVRPELHGHGIGAHLVGQALRVAEDDGAPAVIVEGSPAYYGRHGFEAAEPLGFRRPSLRTPPPAFQVHRLSPYRHWMAGTVVYPEPFWDFDAVGLRPARLFDQVEAEFGEGTR